MHPPLDNPLALEKEEEKGMSFKTEVGPSERWGRGTMLMGGETDAGDKAS